MIDVDCINRWTEAEARQAFLRCCGVDRWANQMAQRRPFGDEAELLDTATQIWRSLGSNDWLAAFAAHAKIGDLDSLRRKFGQTAAWSTAEQAGVAGASDQVLRALAEGNAQYESRFGYRFIVCATGKSAGEMLALLQERLENDPVCELPIAAAEQEKIMRLRLEKLCS